MMAQPQSGGTNINITRGGDVSVSGHHNVGTSGNASGSDDSNLSRIERGVLMPQIDTLIRIASALGVKTLHLE